MLVIFNLSFSFKIGGSACPAVKKTEAAHPVIANQGLQLLDLLFGIVYERSGHKQLRHFLPRGKPGFCELVWKDLIHLYSAIFCRSRPGIV